MLSAAYAVVVCPSVCLCECVSVTLRYCIKMAKRRIMHITPHDSPVTLSFLIPKITVKFDKCRWGELKFATFDEKRAITQKRYKIEA